MDYKFAKSYIGRNILVGEDERRELYLKSQLLRRQMPNEGFSNLPSQQHYTGKSVSHSCRTLEPLDMLSTPLRIKEVQHPKKHYSHKFALPSSEPLTQA
jgi:hypothetical protein